MTAARPPLPVTRRDALGDAPFTLVLSGGFFGFFAHTGLLLALEAAGLRPARVVGCSAGALAGGLWAAGLPAGAIAARLVRLRRAEFWDPGLPLGGLLAGRKFSRVVLEALAPLGVTRLEACPRPFVAVAHDVLARRAVALERGPIDLALRASCCVPLFFRPVRFDGRVLVDGGVTDRPAFTPLARGERVLVHHLRPHERPESPPPALPEGVVGERLEVEGLPLVTPFHLERGVVALERARAVAARWLREPVEVSAPPAARASALAAAR